MLAGMETRELEALREKVARLWPHLDERARRLFAASEARELGHGGVTAVSRVCGLSRVTITKGMRELDEPPLPAGRVRRAGAGRPRIEVSDPELVERLDILVEPLSRGAPESPFSAYWGELSRAQQANCLSNVACSYLSSYSAVFGPDPK